MGVGGAVTGGGLGPGLVGGGGGGPVRQGAVRPAAVVDGGEGVEQGLELGEGGGLGGLGAEPVLEGLLEPLDFALGLRVVRLAVLLRDAQAAQLGSRPLRPPRPPANRVVKTMPVEFLSGVKGFGWWS